MSHNTPFCPKCGRKMDRIFRSNSETPRLFVCRECGHEQYRYGEPWSLKDIQFGIFTELLKIRVMLEKAIPDPSSQTPAQSQSPSCSEAPGSAERKEGATSLEPAPCRKGATRRILLGSFGMQFLIPVFNNLLKSGVTFAQKLKKFFIRKRPVSFHHSFEEHEIKDEILKGEESSSMFSRILVLPPPGRRGRGKQFPTKRTFRFLKLRKIYAGKGCKRPNKRAAKSCKSCNQ